MGVGTHFVRFIPDRTLSLPLENRFLLPRSRCYAANVKSHLWIMQAAEEELARNNGSCVIIASTAGLRPGGSSMVRTYVAKRVTDSTTG